MKKIFYLAALAIAIGSCAKQEVVDVPKGVAIGFDTFVGKSTRAVEDATTSNLNEFFVYGSYQESGQNVQPAFAATSITGGNGNWSYAPLRYWVSDATYKFAAYAPSAEASFDYDNYTTAALTFTTYTIEDGETDFIVSTIADITGPESASNEDAVKFTFKHALSKVEFTFTSEWDSHATVSVSDIKLSGVKNQGTAMVGYSSGTTVAWTSQSGSEEFEYEDVTLTNENSESKVTADPVVLYLLPQQIGESTVTLTFTVNVDAYADGERKLTVDIPAIEWEYGKVYNYTLTLNAENVFEMIPIEFGDVTVEEWAEPDEFEGDLTPEEVYTQQQN